MDAAARVVLSALCRSSYIRLHSDALSTLLDDLPTPAHQVSLPAFWEGVLGPVGSRAHTSLHRSLLNAPSSWEIEMHLNSAASHQYLNDLLMHERLRTIQNPIFFKEFKYFVCLKANPYYSDPRDSCFPPLYVQLVGRCTPREVYQHV